MNVFLEFHKIVQHLQNDQVKYALIGGVAMAYYGRVRFTKDIDIIIDEKGLEAFDRILKQEGYFASSQPWTFESQLTLHRYLKVEGEDEMIVDILIGHSPRHQELLSSSKRTVNKDNEQVYVARKEDLIWLKSQRNSALDQEDIQHLKNETSEP